MKNKVLLSFDIEEFDIPTEYGIDTPIEEQFDVALTGFKNLLNLIDKLDIRVTFFVTGTFADRNRELIKKLSEKHEIASHGFDHKELTEDGIRKSKELLEEIIGKEVVGLRSPRLQDLDSSVLKKYSYKYNSSENPIYLPGRYNNFFKKRTTYIDSQNIVNIPASASPIVRFPLFWLAFKNFPLSIIKPFSWWTLKNDGYLNIYYHPWEFADISSYKLPKITNRISGDAMISKLESYLVFLKKRAEFITLAEYSSKFK